MGPHLMRRPPKYVQASSIDMARGGSISAVPDLRAFLCLVYRGRPSSWPRMRPRWGERRVSRSAPGILSPAP
jgi:hypothetical protein